MTKTLYANLTLKIEETQNFLDNAKQMIVDSRNESGCITYELYRNLETENQFVFFEIYNDEAALIEHTQSVHYEKFMSMLKPMLAEEPKVEII